MFQCAHNPTHHASEVSAEAIWAKQKEIPDVHHFLSALPSLPPWLAWLAWKALAEIRARGPGPSGLRLAALPNLGGDPFFDAGPEVINQYQYPVEPVSSWAGVALSCPPELILFPVTFGSAMHREEDIVILTFPQHGVAQHRI